MSSVSEYEDRSEEPMDGVGWGGGCYNAENLQDFSDENSSDGVDMICDDVGEQIPTACAELNSIFHDCRMPKIHQSRFIQFLHKYRGDSSIPSSLHLFRKVCYVCACVCMGGQYYISATIHFGRYL